MVLLCVIKIAQISNTKKQVKIWNKVRYYVYIINRPCKCVSLVEQLKQEHTHKQAHLTEVSYRALARGEETLVSHRDHIQVATS